MKIRFSRQAQADIKAIHEYIAQFNPTAAKKVVSAIQRSTERLSFFPLSGRRGAVAGTRDLVISGLPIIAVYNVTTDVEVIAVFHTSQNRPRGHT